MYKLFRLVDWVKMFKIVKKVYFDKKYKLIDWFSWFKRLKWLKYLDKMYKLFGWVRIV